MVIADSVATLASHVRVRGAAKPFRFFCIRPLRGRSPVAELSELGALRVGVTTATGVPKPLALPTEADRDQKPQLRRDGRFVPAQSG